MGTVTDAKLFYGVIVESGDEPWYDTEDNDPDELWLEYLGWRRQRDLCGEDGQYRDGVTDAEIDACRDERRLFLRVNPLPFELVLTCHHEETDWGLAVPGTVRVARRGYPKRFAVTDLAVDLDGISRLLAFCRYHKIKHSEPGWYLASYWG